MRRSGRTVLGAVILVAAAALGGCASAHTGQPPPPVAVTSSGTPAPAAVVQSDAVGLIGMWRVSDAAGESADTWLRLDVGTAVVFRSCGAIMLSWNAAEGQFVSAATAATPGCVSGADIDTVTWLATTTGYRAIGDGWELTDADGTVVASLRSDGLPAVPDNVDPALATAPPVGPDAEDWLTPTASLPGELTIPAANALYGRWIPADSRGDAPSGATFRPGSYRASDGCNISTGSWAITPTGRFIATNGATTAIGCDGEDVPSWIGGAAFAGLRDGKLVLLDADGGELGTLIRG